MGLAGTRQRDVGRPDGKILTHGLPIPQVRVDCI